MATAEIQEKQRLFAMYIGQQVGYMATVGILTLDATSPIHIPIKYATEHPYWLLLRSLGQLTDEEILTVAKINGWPVDKITDELLLQIKVDLPCIAIEGYKHRHLVQVFDYLRSIGIALPFYSSGRIISVEEQISKNWIKIRE